jgi:hypothetical protein
MPLSFDPFIALTVPMNITGETTHPYVGLGVQICLSSQCVYAVTPRQAFRVLRLDSDARPDLRRMCFALCLRCSRKA